jgi:hypothetical protein
MKSYLKPVPKAPSRTLTPLEQTRLAFIKATRHLQDAGKSPLKFAPPIKASEREKNRDSRN